MMTIERNRHLPSLGLVLIGILICIFFNGGFLNTFASSKIVEPDEFRGFIDHSGKIALRVSYKFFSGFHEGLAAFRTEKGLCGYLDSSGRVAIKPRFGRAHNFSEGLAPVFLNGLWGYVNTVGEIVIEPKYGHASGFSEGLAHVVMPNKVGSQRLATDGLAGYIRKDGSFSIKPKFCSGGNFHEGLAAATSNGSFMQGYIDHQGQFVIQPRFDYAGPFSEGFAAVVTTDKKFGFIDHSGHFRERKTISNSTPISQGLASCFAPSSKAVKFLAEDGTVHCTIQNCSYATSLMEGVAVVGWPIYNSVVPGRPHWITQRFFVDRNGKEIFSNHYRSAQPFFCGLAAVNFNTGFPEENEEIPFENEIED